EYLFRLRTGRGFFDFLIKPEGTTSNNDSRHKEQVGDPVWSVEKKEAKDAQEEEHAYEEHHFSYFVLESISCKSQRSLQPLRSQLVLEMLEGLLHLFHALRPLA